jgi:hypothetical protein
MTGPVSFLPGSYSFIGVSKARSARQSRTELTGAWNFFVQVE